MQGDSTAVFVVGLVALAWVVPLWAVGFFGGWRELAGDYPGEHSASGETFRFQSARLGRWAGYNNVVQVTAGLAGMHLSVFLPFRIGHPPIFIPWSDLRATPERSWMFRVVRLHVARSKVSLLVTRRLTARLAAASGGAFQPAVSD